MLLAHCDTVRVSESVVMNFDAPERTDTWNPIPHRNVINTVAEVVKHVGYEIDKREYSINREGTRMFGSWTLKNKLREGTYACLGLKNSTNKSMSFGMCVGEKVFVCDNMAFLGDFVTLRRHTGNFSTEQLQILVNDAMGKVNEEFSALKKYYDYFDSVKIDHDISRVVACDALEFNVVNATEMKNFISLIDEYSKQEYSVAGIYNAFTQLIRGCKFNKIQKRTTQMRELLLQRGF
jgi:hypothetical protein